MFFKIRMNSTFGLCVLLLIISFFAFFPSLTHEFINLDDDKYVYDNHLISSISIPNIKKIFTSITDNVYVPLTILTLTLEYKFVELKPFLYHLDNIILHALVSVLVFLLGLKLHLTKRSAFLGALLFSIHPLRVESVAWVTERKDVLYSFFYLLSVLTYLRFAESKKPFPYILSLIFCALSMLAKASALTLPFILLACDWLNKRPRNKSMIIDKIPFLLIIVPLAWITFSINTIVYSVNTAMTEAVLIFIWSLTFYPIKFFWPAALYPAYTIPTPIALTNPEYILAMIVFIIIAASIFILKNQRLYGWAWLIYAGGIFYLLRFDNVPYINWVADRFMYLPSLGLCLYFGDLLSRGMKFAQTKRGKLLPPTASVLTLCFALLFMKTCQQNFIWKDSITLWSHVIGKNPKVSSAYINRGVIYKELGEVELALKDYNQALAINPQSTEGYSNRGNLLISLKRYDEALIDLNKAIKLNSSFEKSYFNRGNCYYFLKDYERALADFSTSIKLNPHNSSAHNNRGMTYAHLKKWDESLENFNAAIRVKADYASAYYNRALLFKKLGRMKEAQADFEKSAALKK
jgi:tetratricopeptide (TPR) repeat protein